MSSNGRRRPQRPKISAIEPAPTDAEAAAICAALEQFLQETAPPPQTVKSSNPWQRSAVSDSTGQSQVHNAWGDSSPWGS